MSKEQQQRRRKGVIRRHLDGRLHPVLAVIVVAWVVGEGLWIAYLSNKLPETYTTHRWDIAWVGLDILQVLTLVGLLVSGWRRHRAVILFSGAAGVLLLVDTWFDVMTSYGTNFGQSLITGVVQVSFGGTLLWFSNRQLGRLARTGEISIPLLDEAA